MKQRVLTLLIALQLSACSLTPVLMLPAAPVPKNYPLTQSIDSSTSAVQLDWQVVFPERRLQRLIELALTNNRDLRLAALNVEAVKAQFGVQRAAQLPSIDVATGVVRQRSNATDIGTQFSFAFGMNAFEVDLFGRARASSDASFERYLASEQGRKAVQISLIAAVADAYCVELVAQEQLQVAKQTLLDWQKSLDLARGLKAANQVSGLDIAQAEGQVASAEADLQGRTRSVAQARNALRLLLGVELPDDLPVAPLLEQLPRYALQSGLPSELLINRPDILQAENNLRAANADIGVVRAAFFPRLSLTSSFGYSSPEMRNLFGNERSVWNFVPQITVPIFSAGKLRSELRLAEVRKSSAVAEYERAIQIAFREVSDGLAGRETYAPQIEAQQSGVRSAEKRLELLNLRYRAGIESRLELLDSQRQMHAARLSLLELRRAEMSNLIALYKALGGGASPIEMHFKK